MKVSLLKQILTNGNRTRGFALDEDPSQFKKYKWGTGPQPGWAQG